MALKKVLKTFRKPIDKPKILWYNKQHFRPLEEVRKVFEKTFTKPLDKCPEMWYNTEAVRESGSD